VKVRLTANQLRQLGRYFDRVQAAAALGKPGMLVAQLHWDQDGKYWMTPAFLEHEVAMLITQKGREVESA
jgi:hypothetical protein